MQNRFTSPLPISASKAKAWTAPVIQVVRAADAQSGGTTGAVDGFVPVPGTSNSTPTFAS